MIGVDRKALKRRIKRSPRAYARKRIKSMDATDVKTLLRSLSRTDGVSKEILNTEAEEEHERDQ